MKKTINSMRIFFLLISVYSILSCTKEVPNRERESFNTNWKFYLGDTPGAEDIGFADNNWRLLDLPHDWSIEGEFSEKYPATPGGGALPGGIAWYRKSFRVDKADDKMYYIDFDGVYMNSEVWINGISLGKRPNGYISFRYDLTPFLLTDTVNVMAVKVDNSKQPNSRWYSGSGIYRNVWLVSVNKLHVAQWGTFIKTPVVNKDSAVIDLNVSLRNNYKEVKDAVLLTVIKNRDGVIMSTVSSEISMDAKKDHSSDQKFIIRNPKLWNIDKPYLYKSISRILIDGKVVDEYETVFGIRSFYFDQDKGFFLNNQHVKIKGVCNHHDLGSLGTAVNRRAIQRQLEILKEMGCNAIRTAHNPPAPELLQLCDEMGFIVMDEMFDMWKKSKSTYDYSLYWDDWHERDLTDFIKRDRNHPSVFIWSIGNEILEQWDTSGIRMVRELYELTKKMDDTRPITTANNPPNSGNNLNKPMVLDLIGHNYAHTSYENFQRDFPGQKFIATETTSALATRGHYDMPSTEIKRWPVAWDIPFTDGNPDHTVSAYDHVSTPWGSTHEETWKVIKKHDYLSGMFVWTGFDYLGEPTPYWWPSRSSYFGIIDLAGFPKDAYYMYKSEWTEEPVLHLFPHWNWENGKEIDLWAYTNYDEVELFINEKSLGSKSKQGDDLHVSWRVMYEPGEVKAIAKKAGKPDLIQRITTAGEPAYIELIADRKELMADGNDLCFITVKVTDSNGVLCPKANNSILFNVTGVGKIVGVDNGDPTSHESFKGNKIRLFNGKCLLVVQVSSLTGDIEIEATSEGLKSTGINLRAKKY